MRLGGVLGSSLLASVRKSMRFEEERGNRRNQAHKPIITVSCACAKQGFERRGEGAMRGLI